MLRLGDFLPPSGASSSATSTPLPPSPTSSHHQQHQEQHPWTVRGTKKGSLPVQIESRKHAKVVVISNVEGNCALLLRDVKKALGTGGVARPEGNYVEIQGGGNKGIETSVRNFLLRSGRVVGVNKEVIQKSTAAGKKKGKGGNMADGKAHLNAKLMPPPSSKPIVVVEASNNGNGNGDDDDTTSNNTKMPSLDPKKIKAMKPPELRAHLTARGESKLGNKKELVARLLALQ